MTCELVRVESDDGLELAGIYASPDGEAAKRAVLHTHGLAGNFYENRFVSDLLRSVTEEGVAFLATNNRGHDYRSDNLRGRGVDTTYEPGGSTWDIIEDCVHDIRGGAAFLSEHGHEKIFFEGHSLGCNKTVYYLSETRDPRAAGVVLVSPPEMFGLQDQKEAAGLAELLARARDLIAAGRERELMDVGRDVQYTAATFVSMFGNPDVTDVFPFRNGESGDYGRLASLNVPILATYGDTDEAVNVPVAEAASLIERVAVASPRVQTLIIGGANHVYWGHENELVKAISEFVSG
jgi:pimeloyl-ACP methyl ester carboxylesterase